MVREISLKAGERVDATLTCFGQFKEEQIRFTEPETRDDARWLLW
jgi:hypothetical protein